MCRAAGESWTQVIHLHLLAAATWQLGDAPAAASLLLDALRIDRRLDDLWHRAWTIEALALGHGRPRPIRACGAPARDRRRVLGVHWVEADAPVAALPRRRGGGAPAPAGRGAPRPRVRGGQAARPGSGAVVRARGCRGPPRPAAADAAAAGQPARARGRRARRRGLREPRDRGAALPVAPDGRDARPAPDGQARRRLARGDRRMACARARQRSRTRP